MAGLRREISEVAKYANPPKLVKLVVEGLCIMFGIAPAKVGDAGNKMDDYWPPGKQMLSQAKNVLDRMMGYDKVSTSSGSECTICPQTASRSVQCFPKHGNGDDYASLLKVERWDGLCAGPHSGQGDQEDRAVHSEP